MQKIQIYTLYKNKSHLVPDDEKLGNFGKCFVEFNAKNTQGIFVRVRCRTYLFSCQTASQLEWVSSSCIVYVHELHTSLWARSGEKNPKNTWKRKILVHRKTNVFILSLSHSLFLRNIMCDYNYGLIYSNQIWFKCITCFLKWTTVDWFFFLILATYLMSG